MQEKIVCNICGSELKDKVTICPYCEADISYQYVINEEQSEFEQHDLTEEVSKSETGNILSEGIETANILIKQQDTDIKSNKRYKNERDDVEQKKIEFIEDLGIEMVFIEGGSFMMGGDYNKHEQPIHEVTVNSFYISKYLVTQKLWRKVGSNKKNPSNFKGDDLPVEQVTWHMAQNFIRKLNQKTGRNFRLPSEAEWEYAARGGIKSLNFTFAGSNDIDEVAWYDRNSNGKTQAVGLKKPNELGIYDMSGNVFEWCHNWYGDFPGSAQNNQTELSSGTYSVVRGGNSLFPPQYCSLFVRGYISHDTREKIIGFRLALSP